MGVLSESNLGGHLVERFCTTVDEFRNVTGITDMSADRHRSRVAFHERFLSVGFGPFVQYFTEERCQRQL